MSFLLVDSILNLDASMVVRGLKHVTIDDYYLSQNDAGSLCFMPSLIGEALGQLAAWRVMQQYDFTKRPVAGIVSCATLKRAVHVGETLLLEAHIDSLDDVAVQYHATAFVQSEEVFCLDGAVGPLLPMEQFIDTRKAQEQFTEINRPGDYPTFNANQPLSVATNLTSRCAPMVFDSLLEHEIGVYCVAAKALTRAAAYFPDHFPRLPVLPLSVLLECILNLARTFVNSANFSEDYMVHALRKIKMSDFVSPGSVLIARLVVKERTPLELVLSVRVEVNGARVCVLEVIMRVKELL